MRKIEITIAIPTYNRCKYLSNLIESIEQLVIPNHVTLRVAVCSSKSIDETSTYIELIKFSNPNKYIIHSQFTDGMNWHILSTIVPASSDWVWLMGDDDEFIDPKALVNVIHVIEKNPQISAIFVPMAKKIGNEEIHIGKIENICNQYGFIGVMGWISSNIIRYKNYKEIYRNYNNYFNNNHPTPANSYRNKKGLYTHSTLTFKQLFGSDIAFYCKKIIDEQVISRNLNTILNYDYRNKKKYYSGRFFYDLRDMQKFIDEQKFLISDNFYRYVNRSFIKLLIDIYVNGIFNNEFTIKESSEQLKILVNHHFKRSTANNRENQYIHIILRLIKNRNSRKIAADLNKLIKTKEYSEFITESAKISNY